MERVDINVIMSEEGWQYYQVIKHGQIGVAADICDSTGIFIDADALDEFLQRAINAIEVVTDYRL